MNWKPLATWTQQDQVGQVQGANGFQFIGSYYQNHQGANEKWMYDRNGNWFAITPDGNIRKWNNVSFATSPVIATVSPLVYDNPNLLFNAGLSQAQTAQMDQVQGTYGFQFIGSYYQNHQGMNEKWIYDRAYNWYAITPDGSIRKWNNVSFATSPVVASVAPAVYDHPDWLFAASGALSQAQQDQTN